MVRSSKILRIQDTIEFKESSIQMSIGLDLVGKVQISRITRNSLKYHTAESDSWKNYQFLKGQKGKN